MGLPISRVRLPGAPVGEALKECFRVTQGQEDSMSHLGPSSVPASSLPRVNYGELQGGTQLRVMCESAHVS